MEKVLFSFRRAKSLTTQRIPGGS